MLSLRGMEDIGNKYQMKTAQPLNIKWRSLYDADSIIKIEECVLRLFTRVYGKIYNTHFLEKQVVWVKGQSLGCLKSWTFVFKLELLGSCQERRWAAREPGTHYAFYPAPYLLHKEKSPINTFQTTTLISFPSMVSPTRFCLSLHYLHLFLWWDDKMSSQQQHQNSNSQTFMEMVASAPCANTLSPNLSLQ